MSENALDRMSDRDVQLIAAVADIPVAKVRVIVDLAAKYARERAAATDLEAPSVKSADEYEFELFTGRRRGRRAHGTISSYQSGCRCKPCRTAWSVYMKAWYHARHPHASFRSGRAGG